MQASRATPMTYWRTAVIAVCVAVAGFETVRELGNYPVARHTGLMVLLALLVTNLWPGWALARLLVPVRNVRLFGYAFVLGLVPQLLGWAAGVLTGVTTLVWVLPLLLGAGLWGIVLRRHRRPSTAPAAPRFAAGDSAMWGAVATTIAWLLTLQSVTTHLWRNTPVSGGMRWYPDLFWHLSLTADAEHHVPLTDPQSRMDGTLSYHWFTNAYTASLAMVSKVGLVDVSVFWWLIPVVLATLFLTYELTRELSGSAKAAAASVVLLTLAPASMLGASFSFGAYNPYMWLSPSHIFSLPVTLFLTIVLVRVLRAERPSRTAWVALVLGLFLAPGTKVSILPTFAVALGLVLVQTLVFRRSLSRRVVLAGVAVVVVLGATASLFAGGGGGSTLQLGATVRQSGIWKHRSPDIGSSLLTVAAVTVLFLLSYVWMLLPAHFIRNKRRDPAVPLVLGLFLGGIAAVLLLHHPSLSQVYFLMGVIPVVVATSAWGLHDAICAWLGAREGRGRPWPLLVGTLAVGAVVGIVWMNQAAYLRARLDVRWLLVALLAVVLVLAFLAALALDRSPGRRHLAGAVAAVFLVGYAMAHPLSGQVPGVRLGSLPTAHASRSSVVTPTPKAGHRTKKASRALTGDEIRAAVKLHELNPDGHLVATNVHCVNVVETRNCDSRGFWVAGLSESPTLIGGWGYSTSARERDGQGGLPYTKVPYRDTALFTANQRAFTHPSAAGLATLREKGVRFMYADTRATPVSAALNQYARLQYRNATVAIYALR